MQHFIARLKNRKKFFFRLILSYSFVSILPVLVFGFIMASFISDTFVSNSLLESEESLTQVTSKLDMELDKYLSLVWLISRDGDTVYYNSLDIINTKMTTKMVGFLEGLRQYGQYNNAVKSVYIYREGQVISSVNGFLPEDRFVESEWIKKAAAEASSVSHNNFSLAYVTDSRYALIPRVYSVEPENTRTISILVPINRSYKTGMVVINLDESLFVDLLNSNKNNDNDILLIVNKTTGKIAFTSDNLTLLDGEDPEAVIRSFINESEKSSDVIYIGNKKVYAVQKETTGGNFTCISFFDYEPIQEQADKAVLLSLGWLAALVAVGLFVSVMVTGGIYAPIAKLMKRLGPLEKEKETADEIKLISDHITSMQVQNEGHKQLIFEALPSFKDSTIAALLHQQTIDENELSKRLKLCDIRFEKPLTSVAVVSIDNYSRYISDYDIPSRLNFEILTKKLIEESFDNIGYEAYTRDGQQTIEILINHDSEGYERKILGVFELIKKETERFTGITFSVGIGKAYSQLSQYANSYLEASDALSERFSTGGNSILFYDDIDKEESSFYMHIQLEEALLSAVTSGDKKLTSDLLDSIFESAAKKSLKRESVIQISLEIIGYAGRSLFRKGISYFDIIPNYDKLISSLYELYSITDLRNKLETILFYAADYFCASSGSNNRTAGKIKEYIEANYTKDISLTDIAGHVKLSASYVSIIFFKEFNINYHSFLNGLRIEKAKELLMNSDMPINDISEAVGFINYNTFSRAFKKIVGLSAKQYRQSGQSTRYSKLL